MEIRVAWEGAQIQNHSLAIVNREVCYRLGKDPDIQLKILPYGNDTMYNKQNQQHRFLRSLYTENLQEEVDVTVRHQWPPNLIAPKSGVWVLQQPWEYGSLPKSWKYSMLTDIDEVWVYTSFLKTCYVADGIPEEKIHVVPPGVDTDLFNPNARPIEIPTKKTFTFLFVGGTIPRKGIDILLRAYVKAFTRADDVCLVIKDFGTESFYQGQGIRTQIEELARNSIAPEIVYSDDNLTPEAMAGLYVACDCLVHPYRGEGFGMPIAEAMASGIPVIIPDLGAATDFCDSESGILVKSRLVQIGNEKRVGYLETVSEPFWLEIDEDHLAQQMRWAYENPEKAKQKGSNAASRIASNYTWNHVHAAVKERLTDLKGRTPRRFLSMDQKVMELYNLGQFEVGKGLLYRALEGEAANLDIHFNLGVFLLEEGNYDTAITHLSKVVHWSSENSVRQQALNLIGLSHYRAGHYPESLQKLNEALSLGSNEEIEANRVAIHSEWLSLQEEHKTVEEILLDKVFQKSTNSLNGKDDFDWTSYFRQGQNVLYIAYNPSPFLNELVNKGVAVQIIDNSIESLTQCSPESFDGILVKGIIETFEPTHLMKFLRTCREKLKPRGLIGVELLDSTNPKVYELLANDLRAVRLYSLKAVENMIESLGLMVKQKGTCGDNSYVVGQKDCIEVKWVSPVYDWSGYATESLYFLTSLKTTPYKIRLLPTDLDRKDSSHEKLDHYLEPLRVNVHKNCLVEIQSVPAHSFMDTDTPIQIGRTMFETDRIPEQWVEKCNQMTQVWVPTKFNIETFANSGVDRSKLRLIPGTLDFEKYKPTRKRTEKKGTFRFLSVFDWHYRKGWDVLLTAFAQEFSKTDNIELLLKVYTKLNPNISPEDEIKQFFSSQGIDIDKVAAINVITTSISEEDLISLYEYCDAFILPTRGEGWGRPFMEAMSMEMPTIGTKWSAHLEFMNNENSYLIEIDGLEKVDNRMPAFYHGHKWASPSIADTRKKMREVYENQGKAFETGRKAREYLINHFSSEIIADKIEEAINEILGKWGFEN